MSDPHFSDERIVERTVEPTVVEREVVRPARSRTVTERRVGGIGYGSGTNPMIMVLAGALLIFIIYLVFQYLV